MPLVYKKDIDTDTSFALWKIQEEAEELYGQLQLKPHEIEHLHSFNNGKRNLHWLSTRVLLRKMMDTSEYIDCKVDEHGKPYLHNFTQKISLSHSYDYAAVMVSKTKAVGIDIEIIKNKIERIAAKFLSSAELDFIDETNKIEHLYVCWCAKEAVYKLYGKKHISFLDHIKIEPFEYAANGFLRCKLDAQGINNSYTVGFEKYDGYMIGYVCGKE